MKYFLFGAFSSAVMAYGISLFYGATGGTKLLGLSQTGGPMSSIIVDNGRTQARDDADTDWTEHVKRKEVVPGMPRAVVIQAYGSPQMENTPVPVKEAKLSADRKSVHLTLAELRPGKVYELRFDKLRGADGAEPLHTVAYYTLNRRVKE